MSDTTPAAVGIDLGTTFSLVAVLQEGRPLILPNSLGELLTPSAVSVLPNGELVVGRAAKARATLHPNATALAFKRDMGTSRSYDLAGQQFRPEELSAAVLRTLKEDAEKALGHPIAEAVISVPAYFDEAQRQATKVAAELAGLKVERLINEPTAAALAYGLDQSQREHRAVVLDLGGGTLDVTVLEILEGVLEIRATAGDVRLGGEDFTECLANQAAATIETQTSVAVRGLPGAWARLLEAAEEAKRMLSERPVARLVAPQLDLGDQRLDFEMELSRDEAEASWAELLSRCERPIRRAIRDAGLAMADIDEVLLVGGATRMPAFVRLAATLFGRMPLRNLPADEAVALGAALQAGLKSDDRALDELIVTDIAPFTLGVAVVERLGRNRLDGIFSPILERGTVIPTSRAAIYSPAEEGQTSLRLDVYQGEHPLVRDNRPLGQLWVRDIPADPPGSDAVEVRFTYDLNGLLEVEATVLATRKIQSVVLEQAPGRLSPEAIAKARERMATLKFHPRDALPNTALIARAEALYSELLGPPRAAVGEFLAQFRAALESQDPAVIERMRASLRSLLDSLSAPHPR